jgi:Lon protease-like protein
MASIEIPEQAGAILLPNAVTFPHGVLPLHIFEPRYRKMLEDAFESDFMICVANLQSEETADPSACTSKVGIIGVIRASKEQDDGCSNLILHSVSRVEFVSWDLDSTYPRATIKPITNIIEQVSDSTRLIIASLRDATSRVLTQFSGEVTSQINNTLDRVSDDLAILTDVVAQQFVSDARVRQSLLEDNNPAERAETLIRYLRIQKKSI